jgi:hypothetical protein
MQKKRAVSFTCLVLTRRGIEHTILEEACPGAHLAINRTRLVAATVSKTDIGLTSDLDLVGCRLRTHGLHDGVRWDHECRGLLRSQATGLHLGLVLLRQHTLGLLYGRLTLLCGLLGDATSLHLGLVLLRQDTLRLLCGLLTLFGLLCGLLGDAASLHLGLVLLRQDALRLLFLGLGLGGPGLGEARHGGGPRRCCNGGLDGCEDREELIGVHLVLGGVAWGGVSHSRRNTIQFYHDVYCKRRNLGIESSEPQ